MAELSSASGRIQGTQKKRKAHKRRNRVIFLTGVTVGILYNPWTGPATREWIMDRIAGGDGGAFDEAMAEAEAAVPGNGNEPASES